MQILKEKLALMLLILALVAVALFIWHDLRTSKSEIAVDEELINPDLANVKVEELESNRTPSDISDTSVDNKDQHIKYIESQIPDLNSPLKFSVGISEDSKRRLLVDFDEVVGILKDNYDYLQGWLQLGILRKHAGDYEGAVEAWQFANVLRPNVATPLLNLADLHAFYIKDRQKAEEYFLEAIKAEPKNGFTYFQTANYYRDVVGDIDKAKEILEQGISVGADTSGDLQLLLNSL